MLNLKMRMVSSTSCTVARTHLADGGDDVELMMSGWGAKEAKSGSFRSRSRPYLFVK